jgi:hypothetical protein
LLELLKESPLSTNTLGGRIPTVQVKLEGKSIAGRLDEREPQTNVIEHIANFPFDHTIEATIIRELSEPTLSLLGLEEWTKKFLVIWEREMSDHENEYAEEGEVTFRFPIVDTTTRVEMKNIPPSTLPKFDGMVIEDIDAFLFEFDTLCLSYDYSSDAQKLRLFPTTLKGASLIWFMGLGEHNIAHWDEMRKNFLKKYQAYCEG